MLVTNHVLSGAVIGAATRRAAPAFALGIVSHFALDAVPHWGKWVGRPRFMEVAVPDGLAGLAVMGAMTAIAPPGTRAAVLSGMAGAALPDLDKPFKVFLGFSPFPRVVDRFHMVIQTEAPHHLKNEVAAAVVFLAGASVLLRRLRNAALRTFGPAPDTPAVRYRARSVLPPVPADQPPDFRCPAPPR